MTTAEHSETTALRAQIAELQHALAEQTRAAKQAWDLIDQARDGMSISDTNDVITYANRAFKTATGYGDALIGQPISALYAPTVYEQLASVALPALTEHGAWHGSFPQQRADGSTWVAEVGVTPTLDANGQPAGTFAIFRDITVQHEQESQLRASEKFARDILSGLPIFAGVLKPDGVLTGVNNFAVAATGKPREELINRPFVDTYWWTGLEEQSALLHSAIQRAAAGEYVRYDTECRVAGDVLIPVDFIIAPLVNDAGEVTHLIPSGIPIADRKQTEQERVALQQQVIDAQENALRELSTPLVPVADEVVVMPLVGTLDARRAQQVMETLLEGIVQYQAAFAILDITGVRVVDTQVAQALLRVAQAAQLLGTNVILTGIGAEIAQTLVQLGADLGDVITRSNLKDGIEYARVHVIQN